VCGSCGAGSRVFAGYVYSDPASLRTYLRTSGHAVTCPANANYTPNPVRFAPRPDRSESFHVKHCLDPVRERAGMFHVKQDSPLGTFARFER